MRFVTIPQPIAILNKDGSPVRGPAGDYTVSFADFLRAPLLSDMKWGTTATRIRMAAKLEAALDKEPGEACPIDDAWWAALLEIMDAPSDPYVPAIAKQLLPFFDAIANAPSEAPAKVSWQPSP